MDGMITPSIRLHDSDVVRGAALAPDPVDSQLTRRKSRTINGEGCKQAWDQECRNREIGMKTDATIAAVSFRPAPASASRSRAKGKFQSLTALRCGAALIAGALGAGFAIVATATAQPAELPPGDNRDIVARECGACHDLEMVVGGAGATREVWKATIEEMISYGARIDPEDQPKILDYLANALGPRARKPTAR
jgi:hypothetical protein